MKSYELIYSRKNNDYLRERMEEKWGEMNLEDKDLLIDLKLGSKKEIENLFEANRENMLV